MVMTSGVGGVGQSAQPSFIPQDYIQNVAPALRFADVSPAIAGPLQSLANTTLRQDIPRPELTLAEPNAQEIIQAEIDKAMDERQGTTVAANIPGTPTSAIEIIQREIDNALAEKNAPRPAGPVSTADLQAFFPNAPDAVLSDMADELNLQIDVGMIDTPERMSHFLGQVMQEVGASFRIEENLNYSANRLPQIFTYFIEHPAEAQQFGRTDSQPADPEAIANRAYADRIGNGDVASGDGWAYRGRGLKQLTGRSNYQAFTDSHERIFGERIDFVANPDLLLEPEYAVRSALVFWIDNGLPQIADGGVTRQTADDITRKVNRYTDSYSERWNNVQQVFNSGIFNDV